VIPNGFRGPVRIVASPNGPAVPLQGNEYRLSIPADGYAVVKDLSFEDGWHEERAVFENGKSIPTLADREHGNQLAFIHDSSTSSSEPDSRGYVRWESCFVGTWLEAYEDGGLKAEPGKWTPKPSPKRQSPHGTRLSESNRSSRQQP
jgi:hypothetical protein